MSYRAIRTPAVFAAAVLLAACMGDGTEGTHADLRGLGPAPFDDDPAYLTGLVVDVEVLPVPDATVVVQPGRHAATTDAGGAFRIGPLEPGSYTVHAERRGYGPAQENVRITAEQATTVMLTLEPMASDVPYFETQVYVAYVMCHVVLSIPAGGTILNAPCAAIVDLVAEDTAPDDWVFPFIVENPGFRSLVLEMSWRTQQFGHDGLMQLTTLGAPEASGTGVTVSGTVYGSTQGPPYHDVLHAGQSYWTSGGEPVIFYPEANATERFRLLVAGGGGNTTVPGNNAVFLEFRPTVYVSLFYNRPATAAFSALPDE